MRLRHGKTPRALAAVLILAVLALTCGCMHDVKPWQRGELARADMRWDPDPMSSALKQHTHFSKEGTTGSVAAAGGGCGCN